MERKIIRDFPGTVKMLKYCYDNLDDEKIQAIQVTIFVYYGNGIAEKNQKAETRARLSLVKK